MKTQFSQEQIQETAVRLGIPDHPFIHRRIARAFDLVATGKVSEIDDSIFRVKSQFAPKVSYIVETNHFAPSCTCKDSQKTLFCKHQIASRLVENEQNTPKLTVKETPNPKVKASWVVVEDGRTYVNVWQDLNGKICCVCGAYYKRDCIHKQAIRDYYDDGNGSKRIENDCGTSEAKTLQDNLNGNNGTGDTQSPVRTLDTSDPFQECEQLDIDQIEGRSNGDLVHVLSNGEYVISYRGIMTLAEQHKITFEAARHDETRTVIAYGRCGGNSRASGKPINGAEMTAVELAKRNTARQLLPYAEIKALEYKAKLEADFDWQKAKAKCVEIVPEFKLSIIIDDMVKEGKLERKHISDYDRSSWLLVYNRCREDAETNGNDSNDDGDDTPSSDDEQPIAVCCICGRTLTNKLSISRCVGPECFKKVGAQGAQFLRDDEVSDELIKASKLYQDEALQKRIVKSCLTLDAPLPVKVLRWLGNEYFGYKNRPILYYVCADGQLNRIDTHNRKLRHRIITRETAETELDAHALVQWSTQAKPRLRRVSPATDVAEDDTQSFTPREELPATMDDFIAKCKCAKPSRESGQAEATVEDTTADDDTPTNGDGKRKLVMGKDKVIWLVEADGTMKQIDYREAGKLAEGLRSDGTAYSNAVLRLTQGIQLCGADISTVELD